MPKRKPTEQLNVKRPRLYNTLDRDIDKATKRKRKLRKGMFEGDELYSKRDEEPKGRDWFEFDVHSILQ